MTERMILPDYPRAGLIEITAAGGLAKDRDGNIVSMFDPDDDAEFRAGFVAIVNEHDRLLNNPAGAAPVNMEA